MYIHRNVVLDEWSGTAESRLATGENKLVLILLKLNLNSEAEEHHVVVSGQTLCGLNSRLAEFPRVSLKANFLKEDFTVYCFIVTCIAVQRPFYLNSSLEDLSCVYRGIGIVYLVRFF